MSNALNLGRLIFVLFLVSCASVKTFHMGDTTDQLAKAHAKSEEILTHSEEDFRQKKDLMDNLAKAKSSTFKESEQDLKERLKRMQSHLQSAQSHRKLMAETLNEVENLARQHKKIPGDQPEYAKVEGYVGLFEKATQDFNAAIADYSRESNSFATEVANRKLFFNFEAGAFAEKLRKSIASGQTQAATQAQELSRAQNILESFESGDARLAAEQLHHQMITASKQHEAKLTELKDLQSQFLKVTGNQAKVPSTSPHWKEIQRLVTELDRASLALGEMNKEFKTKADRFRQTVKGTP